MVRKWISYKIEHNTSRSNIFLYSIPVIFFRYTQGSHDFQIHIQSCISNKIKFKRMNIWKGKSSIRLNMWFGNKYYLDRIYIKIYNPNFAIFKRTLISRHYDYLHNCKTLQILKHLNKNSFAFTSTYKNWTSMLPMTWNRIFIYRYTHKLSKVIHFFLSPVFLHELLWDFRICFSKTQYIISKIFSKFWW